MAVSRQQIEELERRQLLSTIDVTAYNAIPNDGVDDSDEIQAAFNASAAGDTIYFPTGVYDLPEAPGVTVVDLLPGRTYLGEPGATLDRPGTYTYKDGGTFKAEGAGAQSITIKGLTFDGAGIFLGPSGALHPTNVTITDCIFQNAPVGQPGPDGGQTSMVFFSSGATNCDVTGNLFRNIEAITAILANEVEDFTIINNTFQDVNQGVQTNNTILDGAEDVIVANNRFSGIREKAMEILRGNSAVAKAYDGLLVENNVISDLVPLATGLYSDGCFGISVRAEDAINTLIQGNKIFGKLVGSFNPNSQPIIGIEVAVDGASLKNNLIEGFEEPISEWAYGPMVFEGNRLRGVYDPSLVDDQGILWQIAFPTLINHNADMTVEKGLLVGPDLIVRGTGNAESISLTNSGGNVRVQIPGVFDQTFAPTGGVVVYGDAGNDSIIVDKAVARSTTLVGAAGDDTLQAGGGATTVTGNAGNDTLRFNDADNSTAATYTLTNTSIVRQGGPSADFRSVESVEFSPGTGTIVTTSAQRLAALNIAANRPVVTSEKTTANDPSGVLIVGSLTIASGGQLDLKNNSLIIDYTGSVGTLVADVRAHLRLGRLMTSSGTAQHIGLGYADNAVLVPVKATFAGQSVDASSILIKFTYFGDLDLNGLVDIADLGSMQMYSQGPWTNGDFDYDGTVLINDLGLLSSNWQAGYGNPMRPSGDGEEYDSQFMDIVTKLGLSEEELSTILAVLGTYAGGEAL